MQIQAIINTSAPDLNSANGITLRKVTNMKRYKIGYTRGTFDMFHFGHLNLLHQASERCDILIVGVNTDQLVSDYKHKVPVVNEHDRAAIIGDDVTIGACGIVTKDVPSYSVVKGLNQIRPKRPEEIPEKYKDGR